MALRVVIVDDDRRFRALARRMLLADSVEVVAEAENGADALAGMPAWRPDVVLLDIGLPDIDGIDVARRQRAAPGAPAIVLISTRDVEYGTLAATGVAAGYVPKDELSLAAILALVGPSPDATT
jgi:DNA-binding NarL/FixJ family response regulator